VTRSSLLLLGALAKREKSYKLYKTGGCKLGERTVRPHLYALEKLGVNVKSKSGGVGSEFETKYIQIKEIKIGSYLIKNVVAIVPLRNDINDLLLGVGFLKKFKEVQWSLNANTMRFYK
jgi:hypothetical protein